MTDREREAIHARLARLVALLFPDALGTAGGPVREVYNGLVLLQSDVVNGHLDDDPTGKNRDDRGSWLE